MLYVCWEVVVAWESKQRLQSKAMGWPGTTSKAVGKCVCVCAPVKIRILYLLPMRDFHNTVPTAKGYIAIFTSARKLPLLLSLAVNSHPHHMLFCLYALSPSVTPSIDADNNASTPAV